MAAEAAGPAAPMSEMAMARGVHPGSLPRRRMAFGNRSRFPGRTLRPQMAWQQASPAPTLAAAPTDNYPWQSGPVNRQQVAQSFTNEYPLSSVPSAPLQFSFAPGEIVEGSVVDPSSTQPSNTNSNTSSATAPGPVPDPEFSATLPELSISTVSESTELSSSAPTENSLPVVEAF